MFAFKFLFRVYMWDGEWKRLQGPTVNKNNNNWLMLGHMIPPRKWHEFLRSRGEQLAEFEAELRASDKELGACRLGHTVSIPLSPPSPGESLQPLASWNVGGQSRKAGSSLGISSLNLNQLETRNQQIVWWSQNYFFLHKHLSRVWKSPRSIHCT